MKRNYHYHIYPDKYRSSHGYNDTIASLLFAGGWAVSMFVMIGYVWYQLHR